MNHDKELFEKIMKDKSRYQIEVDNDVIVVIDKRDDSYETFSEYGYHLLVEIFQYLGFDADYI